MKSMAISRYIDVNALNGWSFQWLINWENAYDMCLAIRTFGHVMTDNIMSDSQPGENIN